MAPWEGHIGSLTNGRLELKQNTTPRFVGVPGMSAICRHLAADLNIQFRTRVGAPKLDHGLWQLSEEDGEQVGRFDYVISSAWRWPDACFQPGTLN